MNSNEIDCDAAGIEDVWPEQEMNMTTHAEIWNTLSKIDVSEHTQDKGGLTFLSWAWAWGVMMEHYPEMEVQFYDHPWGDKDDRYVGCRYYPDGSAEIICKIEIDGCIRSMWLPIMDFKNKSIIDPSSRDISDSKMRCMVKCFALFGLGHYIYAGEDLPQQPSLENIPAHKVQVLGGKYDGMELGQLATNAGKAGLGYVFWLSRNAKDETMKAKAAEMWKAHQPDLTDNQIDDELADVESIDELTGLYRCLTSDQEAEFKDKFTVRRGELEADAPKRTAENARS